MGKTWIRQVTQIGQSDTYTDNIAPSESNYETSSTEIQYDLNALRSRSQDLINRDGDTMPSGNWYDLISAPVTFENGRRRGIVPLNQDLHDLERKRILDRVSNIGLNVQIATGGDRYAVLSGAQLPGNTTMSVGVSITIGTIAAAALSFGSEELTAVTGANAIRPKNLCLLWYSTGQYIGDPVEDGDGVQIFGLMQSENATDGHTATGTTPNRLQLSFVKINSTGDNLILVDAGEMDGVVFDYAHIERYAWKDLPEDAFLGTDFVDSGVANATRQAIYDNQGTMPVDLMNNAVLDLESPGISWSIRDDSEAELFVITEGSAGGTSVIRLGSDVDTFDNNAVVNDFANGATFKSTGNPIEVGVTNGLIRSTDIDLTLQSANNELLFDDVNRSGSTWSQTGIKLSDATSEWNTFEAVFGGEVSLMSAISTAGARPKVQATMTSDTAANVDINGPSHAGNCDTDLPAYNSVDFVQDVDVFLNGELQRNAVGATDDVYPGTTPADGDIRFTFPLVGTGGKPDQITVIVHGQQ